MKRLPRPLAIAPLSHAAYLFVSAAALTVAGCAPGETSAAALWRGTIDTLENGTVLVSNPAEGVWSEERAWRVVEEVRIGALDGAGPDVFGRISELEVDPAGRFYVFEGQAQELRVFDAAGEHVRTIGRQGGGPGEFNQVIGMDWAPDGTLWIVDPSNNRISVFDTTGTYLESHHAIGGYSISPWPGGFDGAGWFYNYAPDRSATGGFGMVLVRFDEGMNPVDTIRVPRYPGEREFFELRSDDGWMRAGIRFSPSLTWRFVPTGHIWFALTGEYRIFQRTLGGDTLRIITREFEPLPVTEEDVDSAMADLEWFMRQGGKVDRSRFPSVKPALQTLYLDDEGDIWVLPLTAEAEPGRVFDVFDPQGRYLGRVQMPFQLHRFPPPIIRGGMMYGITRGELEVPYVFRARIEKP